LHGIVCNAVQRCNEATTTLLGCAGTPMPLTLLSASAFFLSLTPPRFQSRPDK
jgi:hypothetical protein